MAKTLSKLFDSEFGEEQPDKETLRKERKRFTNQKSYYRGEARKKFVDEDTVEAIISKINDSQSPDQLSVVKDFFKDLRVVRNPKAKDELVEEAFTNIIKFLEIDTLSEAEQQEQDYEEEFWRRYVPIGSERLAERIIEKYHSDGVLSALNLMDIIAGQGYANI